MVPVSLRCPQEAFLPTLPSRVFWGAEVSSKSMILSHDAVSLMLWDHSLSAAASGSLHPLTRTSQQLTRLFPAGSPLQCTKVIAQLNTESSLEQLVPLVDFLAAWKFLSNVSQWVLQIIEKAYRIQFGSRPPSFNGVLFTTVGPVQAFVMEQEVKALLKKEAIECVPMCFTDGISLFQRRMGGYVRF